MTETIAARITRLETAGHLDPGCRGCDEFYAHIRAGKPDMPFAPLHRSNPYCRSGKRPHCTCDSCF